MYKALVIGCGNIGALYDLESNKVLTHVKALTNHPGFEVTIFDTDSELANKFRVNTELQGLILLIAKP